MFHAIITNTKKMVENIAIKDWLLQPNANDATFLEVKALIDDLAVMVWYDDEGGKYEKDVSLDELDGIPLTEGLVAPGFAKEEGVFKTLYGKYSISLRQLNPRDWRLLVADTTSGTIKSWMEIRYFHELQHELRKIGVPWEFSFRKATKKND